MVEMGRKVLSAAREVQRLSRIRGVMVSYPGLGRGRVQEFGQLWIASPNEIVLSANEWRTPGAWSRPDPIPPVNDSSGRKVKGLSGGVSVCSVHFIIGRGGPRFMERRKDVAWITGLWRR